MIEKNLPLQPTPEMIDAGAQRLVSFGEDSEWPKSWSPLEVIAAKNTAERVWRSMWIEAEEVQDNEPM